MKRGLFLCGSGLLGASAIVGLPMMLAPVVGGPVASDAPVLGIEPPAAMKRGTFSSRNAGRSTGNHEPAAVSTEPTVAASHTAAVAHASEMVSDPSTRTSDPPTPEPAAAAKKL